nr:MAG TPA: hypothetical protein [Caudoviricetes sp.]
MIGIVKRGQKDFLEATFGTGDIRIMTAGESEDNYLSMVILSQHYTKPESEWNASPCSIKNTDELKAEETIFLKFNKVKSIDMLIESLQEVRESMLSNKKGE